MRAVTGKEMKEIDRRAIQDYGISGLKLMEAAGAAVAEEIIKDMGKNKNKAVSIICGSGNNGGDGYVIARKLKMLFIPIYVYTTVPLEKLKGDAKINYERLHELDVSVTLLDSGDTLASFERNLKNTDIIVDAMLGTGLTRDVKEPLSQIIDLLNKSKKKTYAVDIPSGIDAENGRVLKTAVQADKTISFQLPKLGCVLFPGTEYVGELIVKDIGIPSEIIEEKSAKTFMVEEKNIRSIIKPRKGDIHKGSCGKPLIVAGSKGMAGASVLAGKGALRSGAGLIKQAVPNAIYSIVQTSIPEAICLPLGNTETNQINQTCIKDILNAAQDCNSIAIGPGIGQNEDIGDIIKELTSKIQIPMVIDADGLNAISKNAEEIFKQKKSEVIITPHPGEMARLTGLKIKQINEDRIQIAREYSKKWGIVIVLKGARTVIAFPNEEVYINMSGNAGMATAGSGDVLTGILASFTAQNNTIKHAVISSIFLHGKAGDIMTERFGTYGLAAGDIALGTALAIKNIIGNNSK